MEVPKRHAANCRWAKPTLQQPRPIWLEADDRPWSCERDGTVRTLESTEPCEDCPNWQPQDASTES